MKHKNWAVLIFVLALSLAQHVIALATDVDCSHRWSLIDESEATCSEAAVRQYRCSICGDSWTEEVAPARGHDWGSWKTTKEATCTRKGKRVRTCRVCGKQDARSVDPKPHSYGDWTVLEEATCTEKGERTRKCKVCGYVDTETIKTLPHPFGEWAVIVAATDHSSGTREHTCTVCGFYETEEYDPEGTLRRKDKGDVVKELQQLLVCRGHLKRGGVDGIFGSGTEKALKQFQESESLEVDGVAWPQTLSRLGHAFGPWEVISEMSDFSIGLEKRTCEICGHVESKESIPAPMYKRGDEGDGVLALQQALNEAGYDVGRADGEFGGRTERAIKSFETANGIESDGIAWPGVIKLLMGDAGASHAVSAEPETALVLTVKQISPVKTVYENGERITVEWTLTNMGAKDCAYWRIDYGPDARAEAGHLMMASTWSLKAGGSDRKTGECDIIVRVDEAEAGKYTIACDAWGEDADSHRYESNEVSFQFLVTAGGDADPDA